MRHVVVKLEVVIDDCVIGVIELEEMFERSSSLFVLSLDIMK